MRREISSCVRPRLFWRTHRSQHDSGCVFCHYMYTTGWRMHHPRARPRPSPVAAAPSTASSWPPPRRSCGSTRGSRRACWRCAPRAARARAANRRRQANAGIDAVTSVKAFTSKGEVDAKARVRAAIRIQALARGHSARIEFRLRRTRRRATTGYFL